MVIGVHAAMLSRPIRALPSRIRRSGRVTDARPPGSRSRDLLGGEPREVVVGGRRRPRCRRAPRRPRSQRRSASRLGSGTSRRPRRPARPGPLEQRGGGRPRPSSARRTPPPRRRRRAVEPRRRPPASSPSARERRRAPVERGRDVDPGAHGVFAAFLRPACGRAGARVGRWRVSTSSSSASVHALAEHVGVGQQRRGRR